MKKQNKRLHMKHSCRQESSINVWSGKCLKNVYANNVIIVMYTYIKVYQLVHVREQKFSMHVMQLKKACIYACKNKLMLSMCAADVLVLVLVLVILITNRKTAALKKSILHQQPSLCSLNFHCKEK